MRIRPVTSALLVLALVIAAAPAQAQNAPPQQPPTIFVISWQCDRTAVDGLVETMKTQQLVIAQELVNEGALWSYSVMVHDWGDEWNLVAVLMADDMAKGDAASNAIRQGMQERFGPANPIAQHCSDHKDSVYRGAFVTDTPAGRAAPTPPYSVSMSYFACPMPLVDQIAQADRQTMLPAAQASVEAGHGYWTGAMRHAWGDRWTYVVVRAAADVPGLIAHAEDTGARLASTATAPTMACPHKDNIYEVVLETRPPAQ